MARIAYLSYNPIMKNYCFDNSNKFGDNRYEGGLGEILHRIRIAVGERKTILRVEGLSKDDLDAARRDLSRCPVFFEIAARK